MKMRASYNKALRINGFGSIIADMKMRASYNLDIPIEKVR